MNSVDTLRDRDTLKFSAEGLFDALERASPAALDELSFGVVKMTPENLVVGYNQNEARLSGLSADRVEGRHFFTDVAPCTNNFMVAHRYDSEDVLDEVIEYTFTFKMAPTVVNIRMLKQGPSSMRYLLVRPLK